MSESLFISEIVLLLPKSMLSDRKYTESSVNGSLTAASFCQNQSLSDHLPPIWHPVCKTAKTLFAGFGRAVSFAESWGLWVCLRVLVRVGNITAVVRFKPPSALINQGAWG